MTAPYKKEKAIGITMGIKEFLEKRREKSQRMRQALEERKVERVLNEREKSSDERELERFAKEQRAKDVKLQLEILRKRRQEENNSTTVLGGGNMFRDSPNIFSGHASVLVNNPALSLNRKSNGGMFFN